MLIFFLIIISIFEVIVVIIVEISIFIDIL